jgi:hypothetical protein
MAGISGRPGIPAGPAYFFPGRNRHGPMFRAIWKIGAPNTGDFHD